MIVSSKAIVISKLRYKDNDLIIKCYTENQGVVSFMAKGVLSSKKGKLKPAYFQPLTLLNIQFDYKPNKGLQFFKTVRNDYHFQTLHSAILKSTVVLFLAEILNMVLKEEESNPLLFQYLETALIWFDTVNSDGLFHHKFLMELTKFLGFYPDDSNNQRAYFDLEEGAYQHVKTGPYTISKDKLVLFNSILGTKFDKKYDKPMSSVQKQELLNMIILYFKLHLQGFKSPKSLAILNQVFG
ncbi:MAG: DNA repair protein RecO [Flavobacteriaceae bacterium]